MNPDNPERARFLTDQAARFGETIMAATLAQHVGGPDLGCPLAFLLVTRTRLILLPAPAAPSVFGVTLRLKGPAPEPDPVVLGRSEVTGLTVRQPAGWWARLTQAPDVLTLKARTSDRTVTWQWQTVGVAAAFVAEVEGLWAEA